jgi:hypothetical protein
VVADRPSKATAEHAIAIARTKRLDRSSLSPPFMIRESCEPFSGSLVSIAACVRGDISDDERVNVSTNTRLAVVASWTRQGAQC